MKNNETFENAVRNMMSGSEWEMNENGKITKKSTAQNAQKGKNTMEKKNAEKKLTFAQCMRDYENAAAQGDRNSQEYVNSLYSLAYAVTFSVLTKCIDKNPTSYLYSLKRDVRKARETKDVDTYGDGYDLVMTAATAIEEAAKAQSGVYDKNFLEKEYELRRPKKGVLIGLHSSAAWETVKTSYIREIYRSVRRAIENARSVKADPRSKWTYIADIARDPDSGEEKDVYRRLGRYADIGNYTTDIYGRQNYENYTVEEEDAERVEDMIDSLNLTKREELVLRERMAGYGVPTIAKKIRCTEDAVRGAKNRIRQKAINAGYDKKIK